MESKSTDVIKMSLFSKFKTGNLIFDTVISTFILTTMSYASRLLYEVVFENQFQLQDVNFSEYIKYYFYKKNTIIMTGKKCSSVSYYDCTPTTSSIFGDHFNAVWEEIIKNIDTNSTIYEIKDFLAVSKTTQGGARDATKNNVFMVSQKNAFLLNKNLSIFALTKVFSEETKNERQKGSSKIDNVEITIYSYNTPLHKLKEYIDKLSEKYLENIETKRNNKQFIYTLTKTKFEEYKYECWKESEFDTTRSFKNMFFKQKNNIIEKIDFFLNNKEWYYKKGIPYTIGFGLHGPPGTGKTSFIKSLAKYTNRHIIVLSLKLIKTRKQLHEFFYEDIYNKINNKCIGFEDKIIVIEDIDAQCDIVMDRSKKTKEPSINFNKNTNNTNVCEVIQSFIENENENKNEKKMISTVLKPFEDELITLDDILNLWDGIEETTGRMLVISSNHYKDLDPALTRPGRIDVSIEMNNASREIIAEMYQHLFENAINLDELEKVEEYFYSPAEVINLYLTYKNNESEFINRLTQNQKVI